MLSPAGGSGTDLELTVGAGLCFSVNAAPLLITELAYPTQRGKLTSLFNTTWYVGSIISAWTCFAAFSQAGSSDWSWRIPTMVQACGPILQMCLIWLVPESPRFLVAKGMESRAAKILAYYHANDGDEHDPLVVFEMAQIRHALKLEKEINENNTTWQLWTRPGNMKRLRIIIAIALFSQWSGNGLVSYYINLVLDSVGITDTRTKTAINGGLQVWNLLCAMAGAFLVDRVGRRPLFIVSTVGMFIVFCMWTLTTALVSENGNKAAATATVPIIFIRAKGFAIMNMIICITQAFNQFVNPWALNAIGWKYYLFYCAWLVVEIAFVLKYIVETRGRTLEETAAIFDGEKPEHDMVQAGGHAATISVNLNLSKGGIPMARMTQKSGEWGHDEWLERAIRRSYTTGSVFDDFTGQSTDSRRQSQESDIAVVLAI
ncbi:hypothetical protein HWV62_16082 [Athelia sp. TMB]|nr:hypothetical protein HWV62_16082 [Athelia sp. TMB]